MKKLETWHAVESIDLTFELPKKTRCLLSDAVLGRDRRTVAVGTPLASPGMDHFFDKGHTIIWQNKPCPGVGQKIFEVEIGSLRIRESERTTPDLGLAVFSKVTLKSLLGHISRNSMNLCDMKVERYAAAGIKDQVSAKIRS